MCSKVWTAFRLQVVSCSADMSVFLLLFVLGLIEVIVAVLHAALVNTIPICDVFSKCKKGLHQSLRKDVTCTDRRCSREYGLI